MRHQLDDAGRIVLADDLASSCVVTGEALSGGDIHFRIWIHLPDEWDAPTFVDMSAQKVKDCISRLRTGGEMETFATWTKSGGPGFECPVCLTGRYEPGVDNLGVDLCHRSDGELRAADGKPFLHADCVDDFCDVLESVFDQYPKVMLEFV